VGEGEIDCGMSQEDRRRFTSETVEGTDDGFWALATGGQDLKAVEQYHRLQRGVYPQKDALLVAKGNAKMSEEVVRVTCEEVQDVLGIHILVGLKNGFRV
jgi:hypothetical protein